MRLLNYPSAEALLMVTEQASQRYDLCQSRVHV